MMATSTTTQVGGGISALKAAFESAQTAMAEKSGSAGDGSGGGFGGDKDTGSVDTSGNPQSGKGSSSGGSESFAASFSRAQQTIGGELAT